MSAPPSKRSGVEPGPMPEGKGESGVTWPLAKLDARLSGNRALQDGLRNLVQSMTNPVTASAFARVYAAVEDCSSEQSEEACDLLRHTRPLITQKEMDNAFASNCFPSKNHDLIYLSQNMLHHAAEAGAERERELLYAFMLWVATGHQLAHIVMYLGRRRRHPLATPAALIAPETLTSMTAEAGLAWERFMFGGRIVRLDPLREGKVHRIALRTPEGRTRVVAPASIQAMFTAEFWASVEELPLRLRFEEAGSETDGHKEDGFAGDHMCEVSAPLDPWDDRRYHVAPLEPGVKR